MDESKHTGQSRFYKPHPKSLAGGERSVLIFEQNELFHLTHGESPLRFRPSVGSTNQTGQDVWSAEFLAIHLRQSATPYKAGLEPEDRFVQLREYYLAWVPGCW